MNKKCSYLHESGKKSICKASMTNMTPSIFEHNIYCTTEEYYRCPLLLARTLRDGYREAAIKAGAVQSR